MAETRALDSNEHDLLVRILSAASFPGAEELRAQIPRTTVVGGIPTLLELKVTQPAAAASIPDGPIPIRTFIERPDGEEEGELLIWVENGYLSALEQAWLTDEPPENFPTADQLRMET